MSSMPPPPPPPPSSAGGTGNLPGPLAEWPQRALGGLIDFIGPGIVVGILSNLGGGALGFVLWLASIGWAIYNAYLNGTTGQSIGKKVAGLKVVGEQTGQPIGAGMGIARWLAHFVDAIICYFGFLFPLWDSKKQTIADKIVKSVVVVVPK